MSDCTYAIRFDSGIYVCQCPHKKSKPTYCNEDGKPPLYCKEYKKHVWTK